MTALAPLVLWFAVAAPPATAPATGPANPATVAARLPDATLGIHREQMRRARAGDIGTVLLGDSIVHGWPADLMRIAYGVDAANFGVPGARTEHTLWRIGEGLLDGYEAGRVVVLIGTNNLKSGEVRMSPAATAEGVAAVVDAVRAAQPDAAVDLVSVLPRQSAAYDWIDAAVEALNGRLAGIAEGRPGVAYVDLAARFRRPDGTQDRRRYQRDALHLNRLGYASWAEAAKASRAARHDGAEKE